MPATKKHKYIIAILLILAIIGLPLFLALYEQIFLSYYQENIGDSRANYLVYPLLTIALIFWIINQFKTNKKSESKKTRKTIQKAIFEVIVIVIMFIVVLRPVVSGTFILINTCIGKQTPEIIEGKVIARIDYSGTRSHEYELTIETGNQVLIFQTDWAAVHKYKKNDTFKETMKRGSLGLLYK